MRSWIWHFFSKITNLKFPSLSRPLDQIRIVVGGEQFQQKLPQRDVVVRSRPRAAADHTLLLLLMHIRLKQNRSSTAIAIVAVAGGGTGRIRGRRAKGRRKHCRCYRKAEIREGGSSRLLADAFSLIRLLWSFWRRDSGKFLRWKMGRSCLGGLKIEEFLWLMTLPRFCGKIRLNFGVQKIFSNSSSSNSRSRVGCQRRWWHDLLGCF